MKGTTMRPNALAAKFFQKGSYERRLARDIPKGIVAQTMVAFFLTSRRSHKSIKTAIPIVTTVKMPLTLEPHVHAMKVPVAMSHVHHSVENSLMTQIIRVTRLQ